MWATRSEFRMCPVEDAEYRDLLLSDVASVSSILESSPEAPVPSCPGWSVADLVSHHGGVLRWATTIVQTGEPCFEQFTGPSALADLVEWYEGAASEFVRAASTGDPTRACWTFGRAPEEAWFWIRRQALEAAVHRWDAESAAGHPTGFPTALASAGVDEVVHDLHPRQVALQRTAELSGSIALQATDTGEIWLLGNGDRPVASIEAAVADLLLLLWRRASLDEGRFAYRGSPSHRREIVQARFAP